MHDVAHYQGSFRRCRSSPGEAHKHERLLGLTADGVSAHGQYHAAYHVF